MVLYKFLFFIANRMCLLQQIIMPRLNFSSSALWMNSKLQYRNLVPATFHIVAITLISMSLVQVPWFVITGGVCSPFLSLGQFFWFGYTIEDAHNPGLYNEFLQ